MNPSTLACQKASMPTRNPLNLNLFGGFPLASGPPKIRVLELRSLECKREPNANASFLGSEDFFQGEAFLLTVGAFLLTVKLLCLQSLKALIKHTFPTVSKKLEL